jgi:hypothetical protein
MTYTRNKTLSLLVQTQSTSLQAQNEQWYNSMILVKGKEPSRCDKVCSFIASTCFGHQYAHHQKYN